MTANEFRIGNHVTIWNPKHRPEQTELDSGFGQFIKYLAPIYLSVGYLISVGFKEVKARRGVAASYKKGSIRINNQNCQIIKFQNWQVRKS